CEPAPGKNGRSAGAVYLPGDIVGDIVPGDRPACRGVQQNLAGVSLGLSQKPLAPVVGPGCGRQAEFRSPRHSPRPCPRRITHLFVCESFIFWVSKWIRPRRGGLVSRNALSVA